MPSQLRIVGASSRSGASTQENVGSVFVTRGNWGHCIDCGYWCSNATGGEHGAIWREVEGRNVIVNCIGRIIRESNLTFPEAQGSTTQ